MVTPTDTDRIAILERELADLKLKAAPSAKPTAAELKRIADHDDIVRIEKLQKIHRAMHGPVRVMKSLFDGVQIERGPTYTSRLVSRDCPEWRW